MQPESAKMTIDEVKQKALPILRRHKVKRAGLFGSLVRGELAKRSDIDILVEVDRSLSLLDVIGIQLELEDALGRSVDLVEYAAIKPRIRDSILDQEVPIL